MPLIRKPAGPATAPRPRPEAAGLLVALGSSSAEERWSAARAVGDIPGADTAVADALRRESDSRVREALFSSLGRMATPQSTQALIGFLSSDDATLRAGALDVLRSMVGVVHEVLPRLLADPDIDVRIISCELARSLPSAEASELLCHLLANEPEINVCAAAIDVLAEVGGPAACAVLAACRDRFPNAPFIGFAIQVATDRINAQFP